MGSKTFDGVWFIAFSKDHTPPHVHGSYAGTTIILELDFPTWTVRFANRPDRVKPKNAKKSDIAKILRVAKKHGVELFKLWEAARVWDQSR